MLRMAASHPSERGGGPVLEHRDSCLPGSIQNECIPPDLNIIRKLLPVPQETDLENGTRLMDMKTFLKA